MLLFRYGLKIHKIFYLTEYINLISNFDYMNFEVVI